MFVRWKRKPRWLVFSRGDFEAPGWYLRSAVLVKSVRTKSGPRLKHVKYLGSIVDGDEKYPWVRCRFWSGVQSALEHIELSAFEREQIEASLAAVVPKPDPEEIARREQERRELGAAIYKEAMSNAGIRPTAHLGGVASVLKGLALTALGFDDRTKYTGHPNLEEFQRIKNGDAAHQIIDFLGPDAAFTWWPEGFGKTQIDYVRFLLGELKRKGRYAEIIAEANAEQEAAQNARGEASGEAGV
jgi:hypothetical protein